MSDIIFLKEFFTRLRKGDIPDECNTDTQNTIVTASAVATENIMSVIEMLGMKDRVHMEKIILGNIAEYHITFDLEDHTEGNYKVVFFCDGSKVDEQYYNSIEDACHAALCCVTAKKVNNIDVMRRGLQSGEFIPLLCLFEGKKYVIEVGNDDRDWNAICNVVHDDGL